MMTTVNGSGANVGRFSFLWLRCSKCMQLFARLEQREGFSTTVCWECQK